MGALTACEATQVNSGKHCTRCLPMDSKIYGFKAPDPEMIILAVLNVCSSLSRHLGFVSTTKNKHLV